MKKLELIKPSSYLFPTLLAMLLMAMNPAIGWASSAYITMLDGGYALGYRPDCLIGCYDYDGGYDPEAVRSATIFVGDIVLWTHYAERPHTVTASTTQGDYRGHTCPEPGGLDFTLYEHEQQQTHQFTTVGDCYYRSTQSYDIPNGSYPGMQGVIHVLPNIGPSAYWLMPVNLSTLPSVAQTFTAFYADPGGYANLTDTTLKLTGISRNETLHYNPASNTFTLEGAGGSCSPGQSATLTDGYLTLNCSSSSAVGSGIFMTVTYNLTPQPPLSGSPYQLSVFAAETGGATSSKTLGSWTINRTPGVGSTSPMDSTTSTGNPQTFTIVYSDLDGYQNIAAANFYMSGNGGLINQWLHYLLAPNLFTMMGTNEICNPGQAKTLSNGSLSFNCATSTVSGSGTNLTIVFKVTPLMGGINYQFFNATSDQAGAAYAAFGGTWQIP